MDKSNNRTIPAIQRPDVIPSIRFRLQMKVFAGLLTDDWRTFKTLL
jgi:hypothetical protein